MTNNNQLCHNCRHQDSSDRGFCWSPERGATEENYVFSSVSQQTEADNRPEDETCEHWEAQV